MRLNSRPFMNCEHPLPTRGAGRPAAAQAPRRMAMSRLRCQRGFSLLELMAVIIIMALMAGLVLSSFTTPGSDIERQASKLATIIRTLDDVAAARREPMKLIFDFEDKSITWTRTGGGEQSDTFEMLTSVEALSTGLVDEGQLTVLFDPSYTTESMTVHMQNDEENISVLYNPLGRRTKIIGPQKR